MSLEMAYSGYVFADDVEFYVDTGAGFDAAEIGVLESIGNDGHTE